MCPRGATSCAPTGPSVTSTATPEPGGEGRLRGRAAALRHPGAPRPRLHWDLRLERDGALASWAVPKGLPIDAPRDNHLAVHTEDHPLEYLDFHGEIPKGSYGAGTMKIWDRGTYEMLEWERAQGGGRCLPRRAGRRAATCCSRSQAGRPKDWMIHRMDPPADPDREPMPEHVEPMLAAPGRSRATTGAGRTRSSGTACARSLLASRGRLRLESRNAQRHHRALSRARAG